MSITSRQRHIKRPSPCSSNSPRLRGKIEHPKPADLGEIYRTALVRRPNDKCRGAFGGVTKSRRKQIRDEREMAALKAKAA